MSSRSFFKVFFLLFFFTSTISQAQSWITRRISNNRGFSYRPKIAVNSTNVYIVWDDDTLGNSEIFLRSSKNGGATWSLQKNISSSPGDSLMPDLAASGSYVYIVWEDFIDSNSSIYFKRSKDGGLTWSNAKHIATAPGSGGWPSIAANEEQVFVAWSYDLNVIGNYEIYFSTSNDAGISWTPIKRLSYASGLSYWPKIAIAGSSAFVVWMEELPEYNNQINFKRSINGGKSWKAPVKLSPSSADSWWPRLAVVDPFVYVVWGNYVNYQSNGVCFKKSSNRGVSWSTTDFFDTKGGEIDIAAKGTDLYVVWDDTGLVFSKSNDQGDSWIDPVKLSYKVAGMPRIAITESSNIYIVYAEPLSSNYQGNWDIYLKYTKKPSGRYTVGRAAPRY